MSKTENEHKNLIKLFFQKNSIKHNNGDILDLYKYMIKWKKQLIQFMIRENVLQEAIFIEKLPKIIENKLNIKNLDIDYLLDFLYLDL